MVRNEGGDQAVHQGYLSVSEYFDELYSAVPRYWWRQEDPYSTDPDAYPRSLLTQLTLRLLRGRLPGRALDLGAGEGADSIRLARLGYRVTAVEISSVGAEKILKFADEAGVTIDVQEADVRTYRPDGEFEVVLCNGLLHYISDKAPVIKRIQRATAPGGIDVVSLWSTYSQIPDCHGRVAVYGDH